MQKYLSCRYFATSSLLSPVTPMAWKNSTAGFFLSPSAANRMIIPLRPLLWWFTFANCDSLEKPPSGSILSVPSHQQPISADHLYNVTGIFLQSHCSTRLFFLHDGIVSKKTFIINRYKAEKRFYNDTIYKSAPSALQAGLYVESSGGKTI